MMLVNPMTAIVLLEIARKDKHKAIVNNAAASALGKMLLYLSKRKNLPLICIVRNEAQGQILRNLGAKYILNSSEPGFFENLSVLTKKLNATFLLDAIGGKDGSTLVEIAPIKSKIILYAKLSGEKIVIDSRNLLSQHKTIEGFQLANFLENKNILYKLKLVNRVRRFMNDNDQILVQGVLPIKQVNDAIQLYKSGMGKGKVLIKP